MFFQRVAYGVFLAPSLLCIAMAGVGVAGMNIVDFAGNADRVDLAASIEKGAAAERAYLARFKPKSGEGGGYGACGDALSRADLTLALATLGEADRANQVGEVSNDLAPAIDTAETRLKCAPLDGNAWLQWSSLQLRTSGPTPRVLEGLKRSALFAPSESWVLAPRLDAVAKLSAAGIGALDLQYGADLRQFVTQEAVGAVAAAYVAHDDVLRRRMRPIIEAQSARRRKAIIGEVDRLGVDFVKS